MTTVSGRVIRCISGFYTVRTVTGDIVCRARGVFRKRGINPLAGDFVTVSILPGGTGAVIDVAERRNELIRPPVSNIDALIIISSGATPRTDPFLIDKMSAMAAYHEIETVLLINKCDLVSGDELFDIYKNAGFPAVRVSALTGGGIEELLPLINNKCVALAGNSGVGKSALLNALGSAAEHKTGEVSERLGRGRHTTRHVELFDLPGGVLAADTPGFAAMDTLEKIPLSRIADCFMDFRPFVSKCRFRGCLHGEGQKDCAVRDAVADGHIHPSRYGSYLRLISEE